MKKLFTLLAAILLLTSCMVTSLDRGRERYKQYLKETLVDPSSLIIYNEEVLEQETYNVIIKVDYGAKNRLGGYVRKTSIFQRLSTTFIVDGEIIR